MKLIKEISVRSSLYFFIIIGTISFLADIYSGKNKLYNNCREPYITLSLLYFHHIIASFVYFGWISQNRNILFLHLITIIIVILVQLNNEHRCPSTEFVNEKCNISRNNYLRDFLYFLRIKNFQHKSIQFYYIYIFIGFTISFVKIRKLQK
jgi:hypothetical protein